MMKMPRLLSVDRIWARAPHCAFTDLIRHKNSWFCVFREAPSHMLCVGRVRVLRSEDCVDWESVALIGERGVDLRDPKLSRGSGGRLLLLMGGSPVNKGSYTGRRPRLCESLDGLSWSAPVPIAEEGDWLWRIDGRAGKSYGISYRLPSPRRWTANLLSSSDGLSYTELVDLGIPGKPNEATLRFRGREAIALVRREAGQRRAWIGRSLPPYSSWTWAESTEAVGGPNFIVLPGGDLLAAARIWRRARPKTSLCSMSLSALNPIMDLPSGGDCGYPGMVLHRGQLLISYYSSHEGRSSIYIARLALDGQQGR